MNELWYVGKVTNMVLVADRICPLTGKPVIRCFEGYVMSETEYRALGITRRPIGMRSWREIMEWDEYNWPWTIPTDEEWLKALK